MRYLSITAFVLSITVGSLILYIQSTKNLPIDWFAVLVCWLAAAINVPFVFRGKE